MMKQWARPISAHLHNVEFRKQVAIRQGECVTVQVVAWRLHDIWVLFQLMREGGLQVHVQLHKSGKKFLLEH